MELEDQQDNRSVLNTVLDSDDDNLDVAQILLLDKKEEKKQQACGSRCPAALAWSMRSILIVIAARSGRPIPIAVSPAPMTLKP